MRALQTSWTLWMLLCLSALPCEAQYLKAKKGDVVPFDTAVITNAPTFRLESRKIKLLEEVKANQEETIVKLNSQYNISQKLLRNERERVQALNTELAATKQAVGELNPQLEEAIRQVKKKGRWYNKNALWFIVGAGAAVLILR